MDAPILYHYSNATFDYLSKSIAQRDQFNECWIVPAFCTKTMPPEEKKGFARVFDEKTQTWAVTPDFRKQTFYSTKTGESVEIKKLGSVADDLTDQAKPEGFYKWSGSDWVEDIETKQSCIKEQNTALKIQYFSEAKEKIEVLQDTIDLGKGDDSTKALLKNWKLYRVLLNEIKDLTQENITWPVKPE